MTFDGDSLIPTSWFLLPEEWAGFLDVERWNLPSIFLILNSYVCWRNKFTLS